MRALQPPLALIEASLFGSEPVEAAADIHATDAAAPLSGALPPYLHAAIARRVATLPWPATAPLERGQVRVVSRIVEPNGRVQRALLQPVAVLLRMRVSGALWHGWLVTPNADYASMSDVVLGERDAPVDPLAAMVQTAREVELVVEADARVLAVLKPERIRAIEAVAAEASGAGAAASALTSPAASLTRPLPALAAQPGLVITRDTIDGDRVATGTPLRAPGELPGDPRADHRALYERLAQELGAAAHATATKASSPAERSRWLVWFEEIFSWRGAFAATAGLLVLQSAVLVNLETGVPPGDVDRGLPTSAAVPELLPVDALRLRAANKPAMRVIFSPDATQARVQRALREIGSAVVAGPNEHGEFVVVTSELPIADAIAKLRSFGVADSAEELAGGWAGR